MPFVDLGITCCKDMGAGPECHANYRPPLPPQPGELPSELLPPDVAATPPGSAARQRAFLAHMQRCLRSMGLLAATSL